jgi:hypothetical protein
MSRVLRKARSLGGLGGHRRRTQKKNITEHNFYRAKLQIPRQGPQSKSKKTRQDEKTRQDKTRDKRQRRDKARMQDTG